ncbi:type II toxin-antitoxin system HicB family antitoxin [Adlercreutzia sp. R7]|uniref:Type II toxin-antitoxin system HicB family antitoxin n=1 Tax=Adlercreutzia wanghongyangiae TaxID=3111451 RepID=A0ABU6IH18_9ACTN|nr:type II toxin-antitoxin system HicB family antitoxin [Adlercreutzia sp. R7]
MSNVLTYKGYFATVEFDAESCLLCGSVVGMSDGVYFEAESASEVERAFQNAVEDYLAFCNEKGKTPEKSYKGSFNVRINPDLHRAAAMAAAANKESLNQFVADAIAAAL